ncbi:hypothetical protein, partial [Mycobacterium timonense]|uniref:hypothetical protein n=1 Tax=Mycobacterium timonense TaxID=701043 RepID=UPI001B801E9C
MRPFAEDMSALAESHQTVHTMRSTAGRPGRRWVAADKKITQELELMTGVLIFSEQQQQVTFDDEAFSWKKGEVADSAAA